MDSSTKRGRGNNDAAAPKSKKKAKVAVRKAEVEVGESGAAAAEVEELRQSWWSGVDEEMAWATCWFPFWEVETAADAYAAFYGDVVWDFDIWGFKLGAHTHNI